MSTTTTSSTQSNKKSTPRRSSRTKPSTPTTSTTPKTPISDPTKKSRLERIKQKVRFSSVDVLQFKRRQGIIIFEDFFFFSTKRIREFLFKIIFLKKL